MANALKNATLEMQTYNFPETKVRRSWCSPRCSRSGRMARIPSSSSARSLAVGRAGRADRLYLAACIYQIFPAKTYHLFD